MMKVVLNRIYFEKAVARRNLSRKSLAYHLGVSRSYLSHVIGGKAALSPAIRQRMLDYFKECTFDDLFTIDENDHEQAGNE